MKLQAIASKPSKKKVAENMRITEQLLNGLVSPEKSQPRDDNNEDPQPPIEPEPPQKGFVLANDLITLSEGFNLDSDLTEPDNSFLTSTREQHTLTLKDAASTVKVVWCVCVCVCKWEWYVHYHSTGKHCWMGSFCTSTDGQLKAVA